MGKKVYVCKYCGEEFEEKQKNNDCCRKHNCILEHRKWTHEPNCECQICGRKFYIKESQKNKIKTKSCCSKECSNKLKEITYLGENNHQFGLKGDKNTSFKGYAIERDGYILVYVPNHPLANKDGRVREHRYIAEQFLMTDEQCEIRDGYKFLPLKYDVHHINENKTDNRPENLMIVTREEHTRIHNFLEPRNRDESTGRFTKNN